MKWTELCIHTTNEAIEPISNILHENGANGVVIENPLDLTMKNAAPFGEIYDLNPDEYPVEGVHIKAYIPVTSFLGETVEEIKLAINQLTLFDIDIGRNHLVLNEVHEEDWATAWKKYYKPVKISNRMTITPTWENYQPVTSDELIIELDPGMAFGTGTHPTTVLSIQALEQYIKKDDVIIDVGCGSGVLSIASVLLGARIVHAYDLDDIAVKSSEQNARRNHVDRQVNLKQNNLLDHVQLKADIIVANILAEIILRFIPDAWDNLTENGLFITSGIIQEKKQLVKNHLIKNKFEIVELNEMEDWVTIIAKKKVGA